MSHKIYKSNDSLPVYESNYIARYREQGDVIQHAGEH
jgi:hypothetical protein